MPFNKNELILKLKDELDKAIGLVVHTRESLENELSTEWAQKKLSVDKAFVSKLRELTSAFNSLTESKIRLDKAERAMEADLTPAEEREAVRVYLSQLRPREFEAIVREARDP